MSMSDDELLAALDSIEGQVRAVRFELERRGLERILFLETSPTVAKRAMRRLGVFTVDELGDVLGFGRGATLRRIRDAEEQGLVRVESRAVGQTAAVFRWTG